MRRFVPTLLVVLCINFGAISSADENNGSHYFINNEALVVARIGDSNQFTAYSKFSGKWTVHKFPDGVDVVPVLGGDLAMFQLEGTSVKELVAVDVNGVWQRQKLSNGAARRCVPVVGSRVGFVSVGGHCYGFSAKLGKWAVVESDAVASVSNDTAMIVGKQNIKIFSAFTGKWAASPKLTEKE